MYTVQRTALFSDWLAGLKDPVVRARLIRRLEKVQGGNLGDVKAVGAGLFEMREFFGPGCHTDGVIPMASKTPIADLPEFDAAEYLGTEADIAAYLTVVLEENDAGALAHALGVIARARGMTEMARASGIGREALYKALRPNAHPRFDTIARVCQALGVKLVAQVV